MGSLDTLPPRNMESILRKKGLGESYHGSKLLKMQASFQAKQQEEKEVKLINFLEEKQELSSTRKSRDNLNSGNSLTSSSSSNSLYGEFSVNRLRPVPRRRVQSTASPVGWDKSYPLKPVENTRDRYSSNSSLQGKPFNKYSGNYGAKSNGGQAENRRGLSLERSYLSKKVIEDGRGRSILRTQSQTCIGSSSEESFNSSRPQSGLDFNRMESTKRYNLYPPSPDHSPVFGMTKTKPPVRDYTKPLPPAYRKANITYRNNVNDSAYSSHSSDRSDIMNDYKQTMGSPIKINSRQNSFSMERANTINSETFRKPKSSQKIDLRNASMTSSYRSEDCSDDENFEMNYRAKKFERKREEERRHLQLEMRKREQELLDKIKDQQRELEAIKAEKVEIEKALLLKQRVSEVDSRNGHSGDRNNGKMNGLEKAERMLNREQAKPALMKGRQANHLAAGYKLPDTNNFKHEDQYKLVQPKEDNTVDTREKPRPRRPSNHVQSTDQPSSPQKQVAQQRRSVFAPKPRSDLMQCKNCSRNFAEDRIEKHENICFKTGTKKRKKFDMTKVRVKGTEAAAFLKTQAQARHKEAQGPAKGDWRKKREDFIATLRSAKEAQRHLAAGGSLKDLPPPPPMDTSDYIQCPHCSRRFAQGAAERHIPKCKDIKSNKRR